MSVIKEIMEFNETFVKNKQYRPLAASKYPNKKLAIVSCMDSRLTELLMAALDLKNGDAIIIKNAGAVISHPFGSVMRSIMVAVYVLGVEEIMVVTHTDCGMQRVDVRQFFNTMNTRGISPDKMAMVRYLGVDLHAWLSGFEHVEQAAWETADVIRNHPFMPKDVSVYSFVMDSKTGELESVLPSESAQID